VSTKGLPRATVSAVIHRVSCTDSASQTSIYRTISLGHPHTALTVECDAVVTQFTHAPGLQDAILRRDKLHSELSILKATTANFKEIAKAGTAHKAAVAAVLQAPLSEEEYFSLAGRYAPLVQNVIASCEQLAEAEDYEGLEFLGTKLDALREIDVSTLMLLERPLPSAVPPVRHDGMAAQCAVLFGECDAIMNQFPHLPAIRAAVQHRDALKEELYALKIANVDFTSMGRVGKAVKAAAFTVSQQQLTEEGYLTLADRHEALVHKVTERCRGLADAEDYEALATLAVKLEELQALDVSALPQSWANDPVQPRGPPTHFTEEEEDECANDPVYVEPVTYETTLA
jgi:hypothetical protein